MGRGTDDNRGGGLSIKDSYDRLPWTWKLSLKKPSFLPLFMNMCLNKHLRRVIRSMHLRPVTSPWSQRDPLILTGRGVRGDSQPWRIPLVAAHEQASLAVSVRLSKHSLRSVCVCVCHLPEISGAPVMSFLSS